VGGKWKDLEKRRASQRRHHEANRQKRSEQSHASYLTHREDVKARAAARRKTPEGKAYIAEYGRTEKRRAYLRTYRQQHKPEGRAATRRSYEKHKNDPGYREKRSAEHARYYERERARLAERAKVYSREIGRARRRERDYGLTSEGFAALLGAQGGRCPICLDPINERSHVDHDHATGLVRGILCGSCNRGIGILKDSPERLRRAADYLERSK